MNHTFRKCFAAAALALLFANAVLAQTAKPSQPLKYFFDAPPVSIGPLPQGGSGVQVARVKISGQVGSMDMRSPTAEREIGVTLEFLEPIPPGYDAGKKYAYAFSIPDKEKNYFAMYPSEAGELAKSYYVIIFKQRHPFGNRRLLGVPADNNEFRNWYGRTFSTNPPI